ncbi:MAG: hypothetical protein ACXVDD_09955, partial [Polyangia bacterium]
GGGGTHPPPGDAMLALGGAAASDGSGFVPLGGDQTLVPGAQGGFHVWLKYRVAGMAPEKVHVHRETRRVSDDALVLLADGTQDVGAADDGGWWELPAALPSFMCPTPIGISVIDERMVFDVTLTTLDGAPLAKSSAEATVHCPTGDQAAFCAHICSG